MWLRDRFTRLILACPLILALAETAAYADWLPNGNPVGIVTGYQTTPGVTADGAGGAFVCWADGHQGHVQRFSPSGDYAAGWPGTGVRAPEIGWPFAEARWPVVVEDGAGGAYIVVTTLYGCQAHCGTDSRRIRLERLTAGGLTAPGWPPEGVDVGEGKEVGPRERPLAASNGDQGVLIAWEGHVQSVGPDGARRWGNDGMVFAVRSNERSLPQIISDDRGGAFVFWGEYESAGRVGRIFAQHISAAGKRLWGPDGIPVSGSYVLLLGSPAVVPDGSQGAIVAWGGARDADFDIYATRVTHGGGLPWRGDLLVSKAAGDQTGMRMVAVSGRGAVVAWRETRRAPAGAVYAQRITHDGRVAWVPGGVPVCAAAGPQGYPALARDESDGAYFAWGEDRPEGELYAMHLTSEGTPASGWPAAGTLLCQWPPTQSGVHYGVQLLEMAAVGNGRAVVVWDDMRAAPQPYVFDDEFSFATLLAPEGPAASPVVANLKPMGIEGLAEGSRESRFGIWGVQPDPAPGEFVVRLALPSAAPASVELLDLSGRRLWAREESFGAGEHAVAVSTGARIAPGVYFVRLGQEGRFATARVAIVR